MLGDQAGVDEVERSAGWCGLGGDVGSMNVDVGGLRVRQAAGVDVRGEDAPGRPHPTGQPVRRGGTAGADLPAQPSWIEIQLFEMPEERSVDIDSDLDFTLVELLLRKRLAFTETTS